MMNTIKDIIPGFLIAVLVAIIGKILGNIFPNIGGSSFAIIIGIILGNTIFNKPQYNKGFNFSEKDLLSYSIVLMGATINFMQIAELGINGVVFIACQMILTILVTYYIGKKLRFSQKYSLLMCAGNAVCGSSAIGATAPAIYASDKDKAISVTIVNLTGTILMFVLPILAALLYNNSVVQTSGLIGGILQSVGQVIASAKFVSEDVVTMATIFKIIRIIFLVFIVIGFSRINVKHEDHVSKEEVLEREKKSHISIPWYIIGFFILCIINSLGIIPISVQKTFKLISSNFEIIALAAIGLKVKFADLIKEGPKAMAYGLMVGTCQVILGVILIRIFL